MLHPRAVFPVNFAARESLLPSADRRTRHRTGAAASADAPRIEDLRLGVVEAPVAIRAAASEVVEDLAPSEEERALLFEEVSNALEIHHGRVVDLSEVGIHRRVDGEVALVSPWLMSSPADANRREPSLNGFTVDAGATHSARPAVYGSSSNRRDGLSPSRPWCTMRDARPVSFFGTISSHDPSLRRRM